MKIVHNDSFQNCSFFLVCSCFLLDIQLESSIQSLCDAEAFSWHLAMILITLVIRNKWFHQKEKWELVLLMIYSCIPCSSPSFLFFSEHVFEHINTEVLRGPNRNLLTNIRAYFGKWWNSSYLKMCWLLIYVLYMCRKKLCKSTQQQLTMIACLCMLGGRPDRSLALSRLCF